MAQPRLPIVEESSLPSVSADYLADFQCIGGACEDSCCAGWTTVSIDPETLRKYREVKDPSMRSKLDELVIPDESAGEGSERWKFKMNEKAICPFQNQERLCEIQCKLGESYLSTTCGLYPRISNLVGGVFERSGTLSCPEITRLVLFRPQGIRFGVQPMRLQWSASLSNGVGDEFDEGPGNVRGNFLPLRKRMLGIVQDRSVATFSRVVILGRFVEKVRDALNEGSSSKLAALFADYADGIPAEERVQLERSPRAVDAQISLVMSATALLLQRPPSSPRFQRCFSSLLNGLNLPFGKDTSELTKIYKNALSQFADPYFKKHDFIFENYLANQLFKNMIPSSATASLYDEYLSLVAPLALLRMHLIGMSACHHGITNDLVVTLFQSFSKAFDHNHVLMKAAVDLLRGTDYPSTEYIGLLLA